MGRGLGGGSMAAPSLPLAGVAGCGGNLCSARADWRVRDTGDGTAAAPDTRTCDNCGRAGIPAANFETHAAMCQRQTFRCAACDHVMPAEQKQAHLDAALSVDAAFAAAREGEVAALRTYLAHGGDKDAANGVFDRLLHVTVREGRMAATKLLLEHKADAGATNSMLDNPLQIAMKRNFKQILLMLMKHNKKLKKERAKQSNCGSNLAQAEGRPPLPLRDVTNTVGASSSGRGGRGGVDAQAGGLQSTVKMCGVGQEICGNCGEIVPAGNLALHEVRCQRHHFRCPHCSELVPAAEREAHLDTSDARVIGAVMQGDLACLQSLALHGADVKAVRDLGNSMLHLAVTNKDDALAVWLVEEVGMNPSEKNSLNDSAIDLAIRSKHEEMVLFLTLALSEADTGSETTAAIQTQLPGPRAGSMDGQSTHQERVLERMFQMDEVRCLQGGAVVAGAGMRGRALPQRFGQLSHMSPIIVRARGICALDSPGTPASEDSSQDQTDSSNQQTPSDDADARDDSHMSNEMSAHILDFDADSHAGESAQDCIQSDDEANSGNNPGQHMAGFTVKGVPLHQARKESVGSTAPETLSSHGPVDTLPSLNAGDATPQPSLRDPLEVMSPSPCNVGCLREFMASPLDDPAGMLERSPLEMVRRDITAAGSDLGAQLAACVARFDSEQAAVCGEANAGNDSPGFALSELTIDEGDEDSDGSHGVEEGEDMLEQCGKGLMTMGFEVPLGGGGGEEEDSCLDVFFRYVRRGIGNEVLRAVRRWALDGSERDGEGNTAVHIAAIHGHKQIVDLLVKEGFDCCSRNREGQTPADCAAVMGHMQLADRIRELGWDRYENMPAFSAYTAPPPNLDADDGRSAARQCRDAHRLQQDQPVPLSAPKEAGIDGDDSQAEPPPGRPSTRGRAHPPERVGAGGAGVAGAGGGKSGMAATLGKEGGAPTACGRRPPVAAVKAEVIGKTPPRSHSNAGGFRGRRAGIIQGGVEGGSGALNGVSGPQPPDAKGRDGGRPATRGRAPPAVGHARVR